ncbi:MAG: hypothetical protein Q9170_006291, partial [Blastenia crenularia]
IEDQQAPSGPAQISKSTHTRLSRYAYATAMESLIAALTRLNNRYTDFARRQSSQGNDSNPKRKVTVLPTTDQSEYSASMSESWFKSNDEGPTQGRSASSGRSRDAYGPALPTLTTRRIARTHAARKLSNERPNSVRPRQFTSKRETWQIQKDALSSKFGPVGWTPRKRLSPDALEGIRALHAQYPERFTTPVLANQFEISAEAIRRILKSKWRPTDEEETDRRQRWDNRGERIWSKMVASGVKPPKKWREFHLSSIPRAASGVILRGPMSNLQVSVEWQNKTVFAGEDLECLITFKNIAQVSNSKPSASQAQTHDSARERWRDGIVANGPHKVTRTPQYQTPKAFFTKGHRHTASLSHLHSTTSSASNLRLETNIQSEQGRSHRGHGRSISIVSIGADSASSETRSPRIPAARRPGQYHSRAASLQVLPTIPSRGRSASVQTTGVPLLTQKFGQLSDHGSAATESGTLRSYSSSTVGRTGAAQESSPQIATSASNLLPAQLYSRTHAARSHNSSKVPQPLPFEGIPPQQTRELSIEDAFGDIVSTQPPTQGPTNQVLYSPVYLAREVPPSSIDETPRTSADIYSASNESSGTLTSECLHSGLDRTIHPPTRREQQSRPVSERSHQPYDTLMMGYTKIVGLIGVDPSLVNSSSFDEVKRKAVIANQGGGGVVRAEATKRQSGLLGSLGWNALGESLGSLLGGNEVSSIKGKANDPRSIPLISTPQTLLFIDLRLEPGQSQSYSYNYRIPRGLPPTHKGKAAKVSYKVVVGVQKSIQSAQRHAVRHFDFHFRVLPSVNGDGETLSHDLMFPHIMLQREPSSSLVDRLNKRVIHPTTVASQIETPRPDHDFLSYVGDMLETPQRESSIRLLSPSATGPKYSPGFVEEIATVEGAITLAIQQSNNSRPSNFSANRFEISRSGNPVAVIMLARPAYRLGEVVPITVEFLEAVVQCYSLRMTLETIERIEPAIALRSQRSISRISGKIHATQQDSSISADRVCFNLAIPGNSTPEFKTSGISLEWFLRCDFVTSNQTDSGEEHEKGAHGLLEQVVEDERGSVSAAVQAMSCDCFDVQLPLRVFGDTRGFNDYTRIEEFPI